MSNKYQNSRDIPTEALADRLDELAYAAIAGGKEAVREQFAMRVPAERDRDADLVMAEATRRLRELSHSAEQKRTCRWVYEGAAGFGALWSTECDEVVEDNHHIGYYCPHCGDPISEDE